MKAYPSIKRYRSDRHADFAGYTFAKLDGSNLRFEWDSKKGWYRFGSRRRVLDETHAEFGTSMEMFRNQYANLFEKLANESRWNSIVVYCEFWGEKSFAGQHENDDPKFLTPIDLAVFKKGLLSAEEFVEHFNDKFDIGYLGHQLWNEAFVESIQNSTHPEMAFEGVIGKNGSGHKRLSIKLKSTAWIHRVLAEYGDVDGQRIINS